MNWDALHDLISQVYKDGGYSMFSHEDVEKARLFWETHNREPEESD